jgi:hypothetical protein
MKGSVKCETNDVPPVLPHSHPTEHCDAVQRSISEPVPAILLVDELEVTIYHSTHIRHPHTNEMRGTPRPELLLLL